MYIYICMYVCMGGAAADPVTSALSSEFAWSPPRTFFFFLFVTLVTGPTRSLSLKLSATRVYEP